MEYTKKIIYKILKKYQENYIQAYGKIPRKIYIYKFLENYQGNFIQAFSRSVSLWSAKPIKAAPAGNNNQNQTVSASKEDQDKNKDKDRTAHNE